MSFEPEKFFVGLMDFFSILLPGAVLTYFLQDDVGPLLLGERHANPAGAEGWSLFLFSSYLLGHFIFLAGSWLDGSVYDKIRNATQAHCIEDLALGKRLPPRLARWMGPYFFNSADDQAVRQAIRLKERRLDPIGASSAVNAFQWCKARLTFDQPAAMTTVERFEADSKFFRSLIVILSILIPLSVLQDRPMLTVFSLAGLWPAFWKYVDQRKKSTNQAYWYVITLEGGQESARFDEPILPASHAGGVVYRKGPENAEYLLVETTETPTRWVLPKGQIERGELMTQTAVREVHEETGVWARIICKLGRSSYEVAGQPVKAQFYLMQALEEQEEPREPRRHEWLSYQRAVIEVSHRETKALLRLAHAQRVEAARAAERLD